MSDSVAVGASGRGEVSATAAELRSKKLVISKWVALEAVDERKAIIFHSATASRLSVSRALYDFVRCFERPTTVAEALGREPQPQALEALEKLVTKGFLVDGEVPEQPRSGRRIRAVSHPLFNCPVRRAGDAATDVAVLGAPYDLASPGAVGMRDAPEAIRRRSFDFEYQVDFRTGRPKGWFDADRALRILEGVTFSDWGDVVVEHGEAQRAFFDRAASLIREIVEEGSMPVLLGGDHSTTFPAVEELQGRRELTVLQLDAHTDFDPSVSAGVVNANCVVRRLWDLDGVKRIVNVGHRGYTVNPKVEQAPERVEILTVRRCRTEGVASVLEALPEAVPVYLTLDVNVLDPIYAPATTHPTPGGFTLDEIKTILHAVGSDREVVGMDVVEMDPARDIGSVTSIVVCHLVLAALGAIFGRRQAR